MSPWRAWLYAVAMLGMALACRGSSDREPLRERPPPSVTEPISLPPPLEAPEMTLEQRARSLARRVVVVDGHIDVPHRKWQSAIDDEARREPPVQVPAFDFDFTRAKEGGLDAPFMSIYVPSRFEGKGAKQHADTLIDMVEAWVERSAGSVAIARSPREVETNFANGVLSLPMGIENGAALDGELANIGYFHARGVRYITLVHARDNRLGDSATGARTHGGLSPFGRAVVREMNRRGVIVDVSHLSDEAFDDVLALSEVPVIASHSSARFFTPGWKRNMSDAMIRALAARGGVVMINFGSRFLTSSGERATVETVADHIDHVVRLVGIDHVGLGSDFDGVGDTLPTGLEDVASYPNLFRVLLERGYGEDQLEGIAGKNVLRVWRAVEAHASPP